MNVSKLSRRAEDAYGIGYFANVEDDEAYQRVKNSFGKRGWTTKSLDRLAAEMVKKAEVRMEINEPDKAAHAFYFGGADMANIFIHASITSIRSRVKTVIEDTITFKQFFEDYGSLEMAVSYLTMTFDIQNRFFGLGLEAHLKTLNNKILDAVAQHFGTDRSD
jgi:hypothetical protein